jgi:hypothetical protein
LRQRAHHLLKVQPVEGRGGGVERAGPEVAHVDPRAEATAHAGQYDEVDQLIGAQVRARLRKLRDHDLVDCVQSLGAIEAQHGDAGTRRFDG